MARKKQFIKNAVLLTAVSLLMRAVSFSFNVYIANKIGASGMGLFALIMSVYNFGVTFAASGINLASTKVIAEEIAQGKSRSAAVKKCVLYALFFGVLASTLIYFASGYFANTLIGDMRIELPLKILSFSLPCVAVSFALGGYFIASGKVYKNSIVQVTEQAVKIFVAVLLLNKLYVKSAQFACIALVTSGTVAEIVSFIILFIVYKFDIRKERAKHSKDLTKRVLKYGLPVALSAYLRSALSTTENTLIPKSLEKFSGAKDAALSSYGVVHGMVMPMIFLPSGVVSSVSTLLVPEITMLNKLKNYKKIDNLIERILSLTLTFSIGAAGILYFFSHELAMLFYGDVQVAHYLKLVAPIAAIMYADGVVDAVLKGLNQELFAMRYDILLSAVSIFLIITLIPTQGVIGYILIIYISEMMNAYLSISRLMEVSAFSIKPFRWTAVPALSVLVSCFFAKSFLGSNLISLLLSVAIYTAIILIYRGKPHPLQSKKYVVKC
ncbi:MAG: oligosaccharide flippase family protein [Clostridia bacterium]|nr:oligosaccharide flippase family protein [Clostridia bacterium]